MYRPCHSLRGSVDWNKRSVKPFARSFMSLPTRECGLKLSVSASCQLFPASLPTRECGLKSILYYLQNEIFCHSLRGSVDWNITFSVMTRKEVSHSLRGSVDWNFRKCHRACRSIVTPYAAKLYSRMLIYSPHHSLTYHIPYMLFGFCGGESFVLVPFCYMLECLLQKFCMRFIVAIVFGTLFLTIFGHEEVVNFPKVCFMRV